MSKNEIHTNMRAKSTLRFISAETRKAVALDTTSYFAERKDRADLDALKRILKREGGVARRKGDEL